MHVTGRETHEIQEKEQVVHYTRYVVNTPSIWRIRNPEGQRQAIVTECVFDEESFGDPRALQNENTGGAGKGCS